MASTDLAMLTTPAPAPSKPSEPVAPSNRVALATLAAPADVTDVTVAEIPGRFAVIRHAVTIPRIPEFRFDLWITTTMITSEFVHRLTASFA
jgi:hypothetical protein